MALDINDRIVIPVDDGEEHLFEVRYIFEPDDFDHAYVVVVPALDGNVETSNDDDDEVEAFAFRYIDRGDGDDDLELHPIEDDEEWDMVEEMLASVADIE